MKVRDPFQPYRINVDLFMFNVTYVYHCLGAIALAEILAENRHIKYLDIRDNDIRIAGLMALSLAHKINHRLLQLDVPKNVKSDQVSGYSVSVV